MDVRLTTNQATALKVLTQQFAKLLQDNPRAAGRIALPSHHVDQLTGALRAIDLALALDAT